MATILLNVKVNENDIKQAEQQISKIINGTNGNGGGNGIQAATTNVNNLQKSVANLLNTLKGSKDKYAPELFTDLEKRITSTLNSLKSLNQEIGNNKPTDEQKRALQGLKKEYEQLGAEYATLRVESQKLQKENKLAIPNVDNLRKKYANLLNTIMGTEKYYAKGTFSKLTVDIKNNLAALQNLDPTSQNYAQTVNDLDKELNKLSADFAQTKANATNLHGSLREIVGGFIKFQAAAMIVMKPLQLIRTAWQDINETLVETENRVVELRRVAGQVANSDELYKLAQQYGQTFENVSELTLNFARNGMEWTEALQATEAALLAINVAELDVTQASEGMIAVMNQFGIEASELESIVDKLNITADNAAVTTEKLLSALQRTGSSAVNAKLSLEETVGIITALSEATGRSGQNIGTAVNSLIQFSTKAESLEVFEKLGGGVQKAVEDYRMGAGTVLDIWRELSSVVQSSGAQSEGILGSLFGDEDWRTLNEELKTELGENFATVTEIYGTASTFRKNYFIALLQNLDQVDDTLADMNGAQGYSQKENLQYLDTYTAKVNSLEAQWKKIANDEQGLLGIKKDLVDMASGVLTLIENLGGIKTVLTEIAVIAGTIIISSKWTAIIAGITKIKSALGELTIYAIPNAISAWKAYAAGIVSANTAIQASIPLIGLLTLGITAAISAIKRKNEAEEQERALAISTWEAGKNKITTLEQLRLKYENLLSIENRSEQQNNELDLVEKKLVETLGEKAKALGILTQGTDDYTEALKKLTEEEIRKEKNEVIIAQNAAKETVSNLSSGRIGDFGFAFSPTGGKNTNAIIEMRNALEEGGFSFKGQTLKGFSNKDDAETQIQNYLNAKKAIDNLDAKISELIIAGDIDTAKRIQNSKDYKGFLDIISKYEPSIQQYAELSASRFFNTYQESIGKKYSDVSFSDEEYKELVNFVVKNTTGGELIGEQLKTYIDTIIKDRTVDGGSSDNDGTTTNPKDKVISVLEAIRDNTEKTREIEDKLLAIEDKLLALEEAKNQRTVRVFNSATGKWEQVANQKDIDNAQKDIDNAQKDLENYAFDTVLSALKDGELPDGFEIPDWLAALQAPTSEEKNQSFMTSLGILAGVYNKTPSSGGISSNTTTSTTTNNNQSYNINGVPISREAAQNYTVAELFEIMGLS